MKKVAKLKIGDELIGLLDVEDILSIDYAMLSIKAKDNLEKYTKEIYELIDLVNELKNEIESLKKEIKELRGED